MSVLNFTIKNLPVLGSVSAQCLPLVHCIGNISSSTGLPSVVVTVIDKVISFAASHIQVSICGMFDVESTCKIFCDGSCVQASGSFTVP